VNAGFLPYVDAGLPRFRLLRLRSRGEAAFLSRSRWVPNAGSKLLRKLVEAG